MKNNLFIFVIYIYEEIPDILGNILIKCFLQTIKIAISIKNLKCETKSSFSDILWAGINKFVLIFFQ